MATRRVVSLQGICMRIQQVLDPNLTGNITSPGLISGQATVPTTQMWGRHLPFTQYKKTWPGFWPTNPPLASICFTVALTGDFKTVLTGQMH